MNLSPYFQQLLNFEEIPQHSVQTIILETHTEASTPDENTLTSDKNNINSGPNFDPSQKKAYNYAPLHSSPNSSKNISKLGNLEEISESNPIKVGKVNIQKISTQPQKQTGKGNTDPLLFDVNKPPLVNLYNNGHISVATEAKDYTAYFIDMQKKIEKYHREFFPVYQYYQGLLKDGVVIIEYTIGRDGSIRNAWIVSSFGSDTVDNASLNSILFARNFGPLPESLAKEEEIKIRFHFIYLTR